MQCLHAQELLSDYVEGQVDRAMTVSIENHLSGCSDCTTAVQGLRQVWTALDKMDRVELPLYFHENMMSRLEQAPNQRDAAASRWSMKSLFQARSLAYAAAVIVVVATGLGVAHTERASLDPVGTIINQVMHRRSDRPAFTPSSYAEWIATSGGGHLVLYVQLAPNGAAPVRGFLTTDPAIPLTHRVISDQAVSSESETPLTLAVERPETGSTISVYLIQVQDDGSLSKTKLTLPLHFIEADESGGGGDSGSSTSGPISK